MIDDTQQIVHRALRAGQSCVINVFDARTGSVAEVFRTDALLLEAPNWIEPDTMILNGNGVLWRLTISSGDLREIALPGLPDLNNDHVPGPSTDVMYVSGFDWHIHRVKMRTGESVQVTRDDPARPMYHFLHGVNPMGTELAFVGVEPGPDGPWGTANIFTIPAGGGPLHQLTSGDRPADGPEYSLDGTWIYFNTEAFDDVPGHAQIARMRRDGSDLEQLTFDDRVNWFPHFAPGGRYICYLSYPPGTTGHPENLFVELRLVTDGDWTDIRTVARLFGGQGTINVNSWAPHTPSFGFVSYPLDGAD